MPDPASAAFATDPATAAYYERRAGEYDEWYEGRGLFAERLRPGWAEELNRLSALLSHLPAGRTLDVACGTGYLSRSLAGPVVGVDQSASMLALARRRVGPGLVRGDALSVPVRAGRLDRVFTAHFYGHLPPEERRRFLAEAHRLAPELVVVDSARRPGVPPEQWQARVLNDGSRHMVYKRFLSAAELAEEIGGRPLMEGRWFVAARSGP